MTSKTKRNIEPILYPQAFLENKIKTKWNTSDIMTKSICLMKYFPKYYKRLTIDGYPLSKSVQSRVKGLKMVKKFSSNIFSDDVRENHYQKKTRKRLYQDFRKTLKSIPDYDGWRDPSLCMDFPRTKTLDLSRSNFSRIRFEHDRINIVDLCKNLGLAKTTKRLCGYFWDGNRFVENLRMRCYRPLFLIIIKKMNESKRFLSSLKTLELEVYFWSREPWSELLIELMKNQSFLQHVTSLKILYFLHDWEVVQSLINCCPRLLFLSLGLRNENSQSELNENLSLGCLQNLQALEIKEFDFQPIINYVPSVKEIALSLHRNRVKELFDCADVDDQDQDQDAREWKAFEQVRILGNFFERWRRFENLKILNLNLGVFSNMNFVMKMFILPLLREKSQLETLKCQFSSGFDISEEDGAFDLDVFFQGIKSLRSLKNLSLTCYNGQLIYSPQKSLFLPNLPSVDISTCGWSSPKFDISQFLKGIFHNLKSQPINEDTNIKLSAIRLRSAQELITLFKLLNKASQFKTLQIEIDVELYVENIDEIISTFRYPIYVPSNTKIRVDLFEPEGDLTELTKKKKLSLREGPYEFPQIQSFFYKDSEL